MSYENETHLMIDFETMSPDSSECAVIDMSYSVFNFGKMISDDPYVIRDIVKMNRLKLDVAHQVKEYDFVVDVKTIEFWKQQSTTVRQWIKPKEDDLTVKQFCEKFLDYVNSNGKITRWWSRSNSFDPIILWRLFKAVGMEQKLHNVLPHYTVRDTRTFIDAKFNFSVKYNGFCPIEDVSKWDKIFQQHNSSWDVLADILRFQRIIRAENDLQ